MIQSTRTRLLIAATELFAEQGYRGAPVRAICDQAGANPGAVSYHFGGKRQLYRAVLRHAAEQLAPQPEEEPADAQDRPPEEHLGATHRALLRRLDEQPQAARLMLRDLADGGSVAVEALAPSLQRARAALASLLGEDDSGRPSLEADSLLLDLAGPVLLQSVAWPVLQHALRMDASRRQEILSDQLQRTAARVRAVLAVARPGTRAG